MSRIDELIKEFCPDGVEYKLLADIATISRGGNLQKRTLLKQEFRVSITVKSIQNMACLLKRHFLILARKKLVNRKKLSLAILLWLLQAKT